MLKEGSRPKNRWAPTPGPVLWQVPPLFFNLAGFSVPFLLFLYDMSEVVARVGTDEASGWVLLGVALG